VLNFWFFFIAGSESSSINNLSSAETEREVSIHSLEDEVRQLHVAEPPPVPLTARSHNTNGKGKGREGETGKGRGGRGKGKGYNSTKGKGQAQG
jgi:hypothetical protein